MKPKRCRPIRTASQLEVALAYGGAISERGGRLHLGPPEEASSSPTVYGRACTEFLSSLARGNEVQRSRFSEWEQVGDGWMVRRIAMEPDATHRARLGWRGEQSQTHDGPG